MLKKIVILIGVLASLTACELDDALKAVKQTPKKMDKMMGELEKTNQVVKKQEKLIPFQEMLKQENEETLYPIPFRLMPFGKELATAISADDLVELTYLWLKEINTKSTDAAGDSLNVTPEQIKAANLVKQARLVGLQVLAGFAPQATVNEMIKKQIYQSGRYESTVYAFLMLRVQFIRDVMLGQSLLAEPLDSVGKVEKAVEYAKQIDDVIRLPFASQVKMKVTFLPPMEESEEKLDLSLAKETWTAVRSKSERQCVLNLQSLTGNSAEDQQIYQNRMDRLNQALNVIGENLNYWNQVLP